MVRAKLATTAPLAAAAPHRMRALKVHMAAQLVYPQHHYVTIAAQVTMGQLLQRLQLLVMAGVTVGTMGLLGRLTLLAAVSAEEGAMDCPPQCGPVPTVMATAAQATIVPLAAAAPRRQSALQDILAVVDLHCL